MIHFPLSLRREYYTKYARVRLRFRKSNTSTTTAVL
jgi:hypothetical protein